MRRTNLGNDPGFEVVASGVTANLTVGSSSVGVEDGTLAALLYADGTIALDVGGAVIGPWLLGAFGIGLLAFAAYSLAEAAYRRVRLH